MKYRLGLNDKNNQLNYSIGFGTNIFKTKNDLNISMDYALDMGLVDEGQVIYLHLYLKNEKINNLYFYSDVK